MRDDLRRELRDLVATAQGEGCSRDEVLTEVKAVFAAPAPGEEPWRSPAPRLFYAGMSGCQAGPEFAIVHACKDPCHRKAVGYTGRSVDSKHPEYLAAERGNHLYLNIIDPPLPLFQRATFEIFLAFVDREIKERPVVIHCNRGDSRAPSLALLYMALRLGTLPNTSYQLASAAFRQAGFRYSPGDGIATWLKDNWASL